jgi:ATP-binding cassette subfamily B protein
VDTYTEEEILSRLRGVMRQRTAIIISHRISTVRGCRSDHRAGQRSPVERGRHDELIAHGGLYAEVYKKQAAGKELAGFVTEAGIRNSELGSRVLSLSPES